MIQADAQWNKHRLSLQRYKKGAGLFDPTPFFIFQVSFDL